MSAIPIVREIEGELMRFHVLSRTRLNDRYLVDLQAFKMNGQCGCDDFIYRHGPLLKGDYRPHDRTRCWHIRQARAWLLQRMLVKLAEHSGQLTTEKQARDGRRTYVLRPAGAFVLAGRK